MPPVSSDREVLTYEVFGTAARELAEQVAADGFEPDLVLCIARGGLFLGGALGYALDVKNLFVMNVEFYTGVGETLDMVAWKRAPGTFPCTCRPRWPRWRR